MYLLAMATQASLSLYLGSCILSAPFSQPLSMAVLYMAAILAQIDGHSRCRRQYVSGRFYYSFSWHVIFQSTIVLAFSNQATN